MTRWIQQADTKMSQRIVGKIDYKYQIIKEKNIKNLMKLV